MRLRFLDRLIDLQPRVAITVEKCVTFEEAMLCRPGRAGTVPPTLLLEWLGQATSLLVAESTDYAHLPVVGSFHSCRFGAPLSAGDRATLRIQVRSWHPDAALVDGAVDAPDGTPALTIERAACAFLPLATLWDPDDLRAAVRAARGEFPGPVRGLMERG
ncbi:MAG: hypothetical protein EXR72_24080 [Myxococcales bacterium]|nr:hypothetical protein [Myxococcales bacterium]